MTEQETTEQRCESCGSTDRVRLVPDPECRGVHAWFGCAECRGVEPIYVHIEDGAGQEEGGAD